jgi:hypothetical protein
MLAVTQQSIVQHAEPNHPEPHMGFVEFKQFTSSNVSPLSGCSSSAGVMPSDVLSLAVNAASVGARMVQAYFSFT